MGEQVQDGYFTREDVWSGCWKVSPSTLKGLKHLGT